MNRFAWLALFAACSAPAAAPQAPAAWISDTSTFGQNTSQSTAIADRYRGVAQQILAAAHGDRSAYQHLADLTVTVGHRLAGSPELDRAVLWGVAAMKAEGLTNVHTEKVMVPHWARGVEEAAIVTPHEHPLRVLGLGGSVGTVKGGVTAPLVVVHDWKELEAQKDRVQGAIVLYDVAMPAFDPHATEDATGYGRTVAYRFRGASEAAKRGAVAVLMRSVTARSLGTLHAGAMGYAADAPKIPAAAVTVEDAELLDRMVRRGPVTIHLRLDDQLLPDVESANVIGDLVGKDKPDELVVIGGHLDSWDVGQGAHDDGAGMVTMLGAAALIHKLGLQPHRTIRVVFWVNEENGARGAKAYAEAHKTELANTVLAVEHDTGGFAPQGFRAEHRDKAAAQRMVARIAEIASLLQPLHATRVRESEGGTDIAPMQAAGVPQVGLWVDMSTYFDYHHTDADTLDKVDPQLISDDVAAVAVLAYVVADLPGRVDAP
ncbi:MAG: M20/M25/M40 family metallo-hydrolase [Kofleriaceae bacterium]